MNNNIGKVRKTGDIQAIQIEGVLMPNGEIITLGKSIGWYDEFKDVLTYPNKINVNA